MPMIQAKNVKIGGRAILYEVHGDAVIFQFGDGSYSEQERDMIKDHLSNTFAFKLPDINKLMRTHSLSRSIINLPRAEAVFNDYQTKKKTSPCFKGTRESLLREMADWVITSSESRMYVLSGLAGIGKSTIAYTIAARSADLGLLGASFFFSRDEANRKNAKRFFTTIAYQLCVYDETFAEAIGGVLMTERGSAATTKDPQEQLEVLIVDPLRGIVQSRTRPILVVVDALDECDEDDEHAVVKGLSQLVQLLPPFKVIVTTRPHPLVNHLFDNHDNHNIFHLQDIEDKIVDSDIRLYLSHSLSQQEVRARLLDPNEEWFASEADIDLLATMARRLFIIASTTVLYILNKKLGDPGARMKKLLCEIAQNRTPFRALDDFYSAIVRSAIQVDDDDDDDDTVDRYQIVLGTILVIQTPLRVAALACLVGEKSKKIYAMLRNLQSVILLGSDDVPRVYHKSLSDYITDQTRCKDPRLRIDPRIHHTRITIRCLKLMDEHLKYNVLGLGDPARFMDNEDGLKKDGITDEQLQEKIPPQLCYSCVFWTNHFEVSNIEDVDLMNGLVKFLNEHLLHWIEVLSLIGKLDSAHLAISIVLKRLMPTSANLRQLLSDALRFISKFYELIKRSALHMYYSALPFAPTDSLLYRQYFKESLQNVCSLDGGPEKWDALVANLCHGRYVEVVKFSLDGSLLISCSEKAVYSTAQRMLKIWDAATGTPISTISGHNFAVANDCSIIISSKDNTITFYNVNGGTRGTLITSSSMIQKLAVSSETNRVAAALSDGIVCLWDIRNAGLIDRFDGFEGNGQLQFSPTGTRLAYSSTNGVVKLRDGINGSLVTDLRCGTGRYHSLAFSGDGSRIASLSYDRGLALWNSENGGLIGTTRDVYDVMYGARTAQLTISWNGSLLATAGTKDAQVQLWNGNCENLTQIESPVLKYLRSMAFSGHGVLAIATDNDIKLYNTKTHSFISTLPSIRTPTALAVSPDCTRVAVGEWNGRVYLWDIRDPEASIPFSKEQAPCITVLALSRDCSRLACAFRDGTVELWETSSTRHRIFSHQGHIEIITALGFSPDSEVFATGSDQGIIKLWNSRDGELRAARRVPNGLQPVLAVSNSMIAVACYGGVELWTLNMQSLVHSFEERDDIQALSISNDSGLVAVISDYNRLNLFDIVNRTTIATFDLPHTIYTMTFLPDNSQLITQSYDGAFLSVDLIKKHIITGPTLEHLIQLPNTPLWHGVPIWHCQDKEQHYVAALFPKYKDPVPVLWIPRDIPVEKWSQGSSMIALGCEDGRVILLRTSASLDGRMSLLRLTV